jgi:hypothetical protein
MIRFSIECPDCPGSVLLLIEKPYRLDAGVWRTMWAKELLPLFDGRPSFRDITCPSCGAMFDLKDDGLATGGSIAATAVTRPKITALGAPSGPVLGGQRIGITGEALNVGHLVVKIGGRSATIISRTAVSVLISTPAPRFALKIEESGYQRLILTGVTGNFSLGESITGPGGSTGTIRVKNENVLHVLIASGTFLAGQQIRGGRNGAAAMVAGSTIPVLIGGEQIDGQTSGARAAMALPDKANNPTKSFSPGEFILGQASGTYAKLGVPAHPVVFDVSVENEYGQRPGGTSILTAAYTYV